jgi:hypothetical protein
MTMFFVADQFDKLMPEHPEAVSLDRLRTFGGDQMTTRPDR